MVDPKTVSEFLFRVRAVINKFGMESGIEEAIPLRKVMDDLRGTTDAYAALGRKVVEEREALRAIADAPVVDLNVTVRQIRSILAEADRLASGGTKDE